MLARKNSDGIKFDRKMSVLEILGQLAILVAEPDSVRNKHVEVFVDNQGGRPTAVCTVTQS